MPIYRLRRQDTNVIVLRSLNNALSYQRVIFGSELC
jgi:hypothetical protein